MSRQREVMPRMTIILLNLGHAKIRSQFMKPLWTYQLSPKNPETPTRASTKRLLISTHQGHFSPWSASSTLRSSRGEKKPQPKPLWNMVSRRSTPNFPLNIHPDLPLLRLCKDSRNATRLASERNLPGDSLTSADEHNFRVYNDWVHQNPVTHLDGRIEEDDKWKQIWK